jgi:hypothetical protein
MLNIFYKKIISVPITILILIAFITPISILAVMPVEAEAQIGSSCLPAFTAFLGLTVVEQGVATFKSVPVHDEGARTTQQIQSGQSRSSFIKDCIEHGIALAIAKKLLAAMTDSIVQWINGGFNGQPTFLANPSGFFADQADQIAGELIVDQGLGFLCSPFQLQVRIALALDYETSYSERSKCTLSQVVNNVEGAYKDFAEAGWSGWFSITQNSNNNAIGSYLGAKAQLDARISSSRSLQLMEVNWGGGFLS